jgi:hypothetical protein
LANQRLLPPAIRRGLLLSVGVSLLGIVWLNARTVTPATLGHLRRANLLFVALACLAMALAWLIEAWRIRLLLRLSGETVGLWRLVRIVLATFFAASVTPFASGQGPVQVYLLHREGASVGRATAILSLRLFLTIVSFTVGIPLLLLLVRLGITERVHALVNWGVAASFLLAAVFFLFLRFPHGVAQAIHTFTAKYLARLFRPEAVDRLLDRLVAEVDEFTATLGRLDRTRVVLLLVAVVLTVLYWVAYFAAAPLLLLAFGRRFDPVRVMALQAVFTFLISMVPIPGGSGLAELGFAQIFAHLLPAALVGVFVSLWRLITYYLSLLAGAALFASLLAGGQPGPGGGSSKV